ncbi:MAG: DUF1566 domain-containing protein [Terracidiphilus sp.]
MSRIKLFLAMAGLGILSACGGSRNDPGNTNPAQPPATNTVTGTVQFKGAPLAGVTITLWLTNTNTVEQTVTTDASGNYSFSGLSATGDATAVYQLWATKAGYGFYPSVGAGAEVIRFDHTGNFKGPWESSAIYLTVIQYSSLAGQSLSGADFTAYDGSNPLVSLPATGQSVSYASGDDGAIKKGVAWPGVRFTDNQDGTVTDHLTGLVWLKDAGCFAPSLFAAALADANQLANGACGLTDGSKAGDWRMPNINELESLVDPSRSNPALAASYPFTNVSNAIYWSSTSYFGGDEGSPDAWAIRMSDGRFINDSLLNVKTTSSNGVWAVKGLGSGGAIKLQATGQYVGFTAGDDGSYQAGVPATFERYIDNGNGSLTDTVTGLIWLKQANCINADWASAISTVNALASGQCGLTDNSTAGSWRMPNRNEMLSLSDRNENNLADFFDAYFLNPDGSYFHKSIFSNFDAYQYYWTSTTDDADSTEAWTVFSCDFGVYDTPKANTGYTLAVR